MTQTVKDVNPDTWRKFAGLCKIKGIKIGEELTKVLEDYVKKNLK